MVNEAIEDGVAAPAQGSLERFERPTAPMSEKLRAGKVAPRAKSNRNSGRDHLGIPGEIMSVKPGEIVGMPEGSNRSRAMECSWHDFVDLFEAGLN